MPDDRAETATWRDPANRDGESRTQPGEDRIEPHAIASELTEDKTVGASGGRVDNSDPAVTPERAAFRQPGDQPPRDQAVTKTEKDIGQHMMIVLGIVLLAAVGFAAVFFHNWILLGVGLLVIIPFMFFVLAPVWLASTTKVAQDDAVRQQRGGHDAERK